MSEVSVPVPSSDAGALAHSPPPSPSSTSLLDFPPEATLRIWRKPLTGAEAIDEGEIHISELIPGDGDHVLVCFTTMATDDWEKIKRELGVGQQLDLNPLLVGAVDTTHIASGLWGAGAFAGLHGLTKEPKRGTVFVPSPMLMRLLKIERADRSSRGRNALFLIRNGHICAEWISGGDDGNRPHDWTTILSVVN